MSRSVHVPAGIFDRRRYGFAQVAIVPTPLGNAVPWVWPGCLGRGPEHHRRRRHRLPTREEPRKSRGRASIGERETRSSRRATTFYQASTKAKPSAAHSRQFGDTPPCSTWIGVPSLADDEFLVEVSPHRFSSRGKLIEDVVLPDQRSAARQNRRCLRDDSFDQLRG
jgi:hypothetical protein